MARLRKFVCYRKLERPFTRKSKYRKKAFIRADPHPKVVKFDVGNTKGAFAYQVDLVTKSELQIRDNALEAARQTCNRHIEKKLGKNGFHLKVRVYPHHILREHALASGAGADRFSTGMAKSYGKPAGIAARLREGQAVITLYVDEANIPVARQALTRARHKLPTDCQIVVTKAAENKAQ